MDKTLLQPRGKTMKKPTPKKTVQKKHTTVKKKVTKSSKEKKLNSKDRQAEILQLMIEKGSWFLNKTELGRHYGVSDKQIGKDIKRLESLIPKKDIINIKNNLLAVHQKAIKKLEKLSDNNFVEPQHITGALKAVGYLSEKYVRLLEDFGDKAKVADKVDIAGKLETNLSSDERDDLLSELKESLKEK